MRLVALHRSLFMKLPKAVLTFIVLGSVLGIAEAAIINVTESNWGTVADVGSFAWAVEQANTNSGFDTIHVQPGLQINADEGDKQDQTWLAIFTDSVTIEGNHATLVANPTYVTDSGDIATKNKIIGSAYGSPFAPSDVVTTPGVSFAQVGVRDQDNTGVHVSVRNLNADGVGSVATVNENAELTVNGGSFQNIVNYTGVDGRPAFESLGGATLNLDGISLSRNFPFGEVIPVGDVAIFSGSIGGLDSTLNMQNSTISNSFGAGAIFWDGGTANVVSSILSNSGGLQVLEGTLNLTNSIVHFDGGETLQQTNRIVAVGGTANVTASTVLYNSLYTTGPPQPYDNNGMPLTATLGGTLNFNSSAVVPLNWDTFWPDKDSYAEFSGGNLIADDFSFISATASQDRAALESLFNNTNFFTAGDSFPISVVSGVSDFFEPLPQGAVPLSTSSLINAVIDAGPGGANELINPIDGQPLLVDVYGNPRTNGLGARNIGAVQSVPEPSSIVLWLAGFIGLSVWTRAQRPQRYRPRGMGGADGPRRTSATPGVRRWKHVIPSEGIHLLRPGS